MKSTIDNLSVKPETEGKEPENMSSIVTTASTPLSSLEMSYSNRVNQAVTLTTGTSKSNF